MAEKTRASKSGIGFQIQKKLEDRYDFEESLGIPARIISWVNEITKNDHPPCPGTSWNQIAAHYKDGVALCKFLNKLLAQAGKPPIKFKATANTAFVAMENIENFNKGIQVYGLGEDAVFASIDLYEGQKGPLLNVLNCLHKVGLEANCQSVTPAYDVIQPPPFE